MSKINDLHEKAMQLSDEAFFAKRRGDLDGFLRFSREALELETQAADLLKENLEAEPSRSVLYRSAASIAIDCQEFRQAERLIATALSGNPPTEIAVELRDLLEQLSFKQQAEIKSNKIKSAKLTIANRTLKVTGYRVGNRFFLQELPKAESKV
jgi:uncharacterized protein HemY